MRGEEKVEHFTGYRLMGGFVKTEADLRRAVLENLKSIAVRDLLGLRFRTPEELKEMGLDVGKMERRAEFQTHDKQDGEILAPFGRSKGQPITEISDSDLEWLANAVKKSVADPDKAKWKGKNETLLQALREEYKRRRAPKSSDAAEAKSGQAPEKYQPKEGEFDFGPPPLTEEELAEMPDGVDGDYPEPGSEG